MKHFKVLVCLMVAFCGMVFGLTSCKEPEEELHVHEYGEWVVLNDATCTNKGLKGRDCKSCPAFEREEIEQLAHEYVASYNVVEPTCNNAGAKLYTCKYCKDIKTESIVALGHSFSNGVCTRCEELENEIPTFTISFELNGGELYANSVTYDQNSKITLPNPAKEGYIFKGWYLDKELTKAVDKTITVEKNMTVYAKWDIVGYVITLDANGGYVEEGNVVVNENERFTLEIPLTDEYVFFVGWYLGEQQMTDEFGIGLKTWSLREEVTLKAKYEKSKVVDNIKFMYEGEYPQTVVTNEEVIKELSKITETNKRGYLEYNGRQYAKVTYTGRSGIVKFNNGVVLQKDKTYYFVVEPILWRILDEVNGVAIAEKIIDTAQFYESSKEHLDEKEAHPNNYEYSDVSSWLNSDIKHAKDSFIYDAFANPNDVLTLRKDIDNSASTTMDENNKYACVTTTAYLYLLSYSEFNSAYEIKINKESKVTDYAIARGVNVDNYSMNGEWWLRTPSAAEANKALAVSTIGDVFECVVNDSEIGVRPVGTFKKAVK